MIVTEMIIIMKHINNSNNNNNDNNYNNNNIDNKTENDCNVDKVLVMILIT